MKKYILITVLFLSLFVAGVKIPQAQAGQFVASIEWLLTNMTDANNNPISITQPSFMLDIDFGDTYYNVYGAMCSMDSRDCTPLIGAGYMYSNSDSQNDYSVHMDVRGGSKLYRLVISPDDLSGMCGVYDRNGNFEGAASLVFSQIWNAR